MHSNSTTSNAPGDAGKALTLEAQAQEVLDELWGKHLIPFKLNVGKLSGVSDLTSSIFTIAGYPGPRSFQSGSIMEGDGSSCCLGSRRNSKRPFAK